MMAASKMPAITTPPITVGRKKVVGNMTSSAMINKRTTELKSRDRLASSRFTKLLYAASSGGPVSLSHHWNNPSDRPCSSSSISSTIESGLVPGAPRCVLLPIQTHLLYYYHSTKSHHALPCRPLLVNTFMSHPEVFALSFCLAQLLDKRDANRASE